MQAKELANVEGDWHEFESKAHRRENDKREKERRKEEYMREKEKRKARDADLAEPTAVDKKVRLDNTVAPKDDMAPPPSTTHGAAPTETNALPEASRDGMNDDNNEDSEGEGGAPMSMSPN